MSVLIGCQQNPPDYTSKYTAPPSVETKPGVPMAIIGDSYTGGSPMGGKGPRSWPSLVTSQLREQGTPIDPDVAVESGAGYAALGNQRARVFADLIPSVVRPKDKLVVFFGSRNDTNVAAPELISAVRRTFSDARAAAPGAGLFVVGPPWVDANPSPGVLQARDIVRAEAQAAGAVFIDPIADGWFVGRPDLIGKDGVHPTDAGHQYIAEKLAPLLAQQVQAVPAP